MIRVLFVHDHDVSEIPDGGAQQTTAELMRQCHWPVELALPSTIDSYDLDAYNLLVVSNCKFFSRPQLERVLGHRCFIKHERDYYNLVGDHADLRRALFEGAQAAVFLSPGHAHAFAQEHPDIGWENVPVQIIPPPVDTARFNPRGRARRPVYAFTSSLHPHKGVDNLIAWARANPDKQVVAYGRGPLRPQLEAEPNIDYRGSLPYEQMPDLFNEVAGFIHLPNWMEPFGRAVMEARLCGCEMVLNDRVGAATYAWFGDYYALHYKMRRAANEFWAFAMQRERGRRCTG